jgi:hypothetical protein
MDCLRPCAGLCCCITQFELEKLPGVVGAVACPAPPNWGIRLHNGLLALIHGKKDSRAVGR